jgi:phosphoribosylformylglycinamidine synthase subunit PurS
VPIVVVDVMPRRELLDPQGKALCRVLGQVSETRFTDVRVGKRFELTVDDPPDENAMDDIRRIAREVLSNSVIEDVVSIHEAPGASANVAAPT